MMGRSTSLFRPPPVLLSKMQFYVQDYSSKEALRIEDETDAE